MILREANNILQNPKDHWSREIEEAKGYVVNFVKVLCRLSKEGNYIFEADDFDSIINEVDWQINNMSTAVCGDCKNYDPGLSICQNGFAREYRKYQIQPTEEACGYYVDEKKVNTK